MTCSSKRGIRNNNPFNIKKSNHNWIGKVKGTDPTFEVFSNMYYGIRAGLKLLINYVDRGFNTPYKIISRFAPSCENNVSNYVAFICRDSTGAYFISPDTKIEKLQTLCKIANRMVKYECGLSYPEEVNFCLTADDFQKIIDFYKLNKNGILL